MNVIPSGDGKVGLCTTKKAEVTNEKTGRYEVLTTCKLKCLCVKNHH
jgi:hypothetical protein